MNDPFDFLSGLGQKPADKLADTNRKLAEQRAQREQEILDKTPVPPMRGKSINGIKYLRAEDVMIALDSTKSAVRVAAKIRAWLR